MAERKFFTINKKYTLLLMWLVLLLCGFCVATAKAESNEEYSPQNIDVIYVIDGSGSMLHSDPENLALTAGKLFTDLCGSSDRDTRAGYVFYSHNIDSSVGLTSLQEPGNKERLQNELMGLAYERENDTDIALGLTNGVQLLKEGNAFDGSRNPMIILLSDGMTDLPKGPRTVEESQEELNHTIDEAKTLGLPVYTIGLNFNQNVDVSTMKGIADATGAKYYETDSAADLNGIVRDIFNDHTEGVMDSLQPHYDPDTGRFYTSFDVEDESIYLVNIVILTSYGVSDPILTDPEGNGIDIEQNDRISVSSDETYMTIKILYPAKGEWRLSVSGDANDAIDISMLSTRDLNFRLDQIEPTEYKIGEDISFTAHLRRVDENITDDDLLQGTAASYSVLDVNSNSVIDSGNMFYDEQLHSFSASVAAKQNGEYKVTAQFTSPETSLTLNSNEQVFSVVVLPLALSRESNKIDIKFSPFEKTKEILLDQYYTYDPTAIITCNTSAAEGAPGVEYNQEEHKITLTKGKSSKSELVLDIADNYGSTSNLIIHVTNQSLIVPLIIVAVVIVAAIIALRKIIEGKKPKLSKPLSISLGLSDAYLEQTPAKATLIMPSQKSESSLIAIIMENTIAAGPYTQAFSVTGLQELAEKIVIRALPQEKIKIVIKKGLTGELYIDNIEADILKENEKTLGNGDIVSILYGNGSSKNAIILSMDSEDSMSGPFGGGSGREGSNAFDPNGGFGTSNPFGNPDMSSGIDAGNNPFGESHGNGFSSEGNMPSDDEKTDNSNPFGNFF